LTQSISTDLSSLTNNTIFLAWEETKDYFGFVEEADFDQPLFKLRERIETDQVIETAQPYQFLNK
jgi:hypothetical protein